MHTKQLHTISILKLTIVAQRGHFDIILDENNFNVGQLGLKSLLVLSSRDSGRALQGKPIYQK